MHIQTYSIHRVFDNRYNIVDRLNWTEKSCIIYIYISHYYYIFKRYLKDIAIQN